MKTFVIKDNEGMRAALEFAASMEFSEELPWSITFDEYKETRRGEQRRLYWYWVGIVAKETGHTENYIHAQNKLMILQPYLLTIPRHQKRAIFNQDILDDSRTWNKKLVSAFDRIRSSTLSVSDMAEFLNMVQSFYVLNADIILTSKQSGIPEQK
jgi:hypothetical protein